MLKLFKFQNVHLDQNDWIWIRIYVRRMYGWCTFYYTFPITTRTVSHCILFYSIVSPTPPSRHSSANTELSAFNITQPLYPDPKFVSNVTVDGREERCWWRNMISFLFMKYFHFNCCIVHLFWTMLAVGSEATPSQPPTLLPSPMYNNLTFEFLIIQFGAHIYLIFFRIIPMKLYPRTPSSLLQSSKKGSFSQLQHHNNSPLTRILFGEHQRTASRSECVGVRI